MQLSHALLPHANTHSPDDYYGSDLNVSMNQYH